MAISMRLGLLTHYGALYASQRMLRCADPLQSPMDSKCHIFALVKENIVEFAKSASYLIHAFPMLLLKVNRFFSANGL